jgi:ATP synthase protein I
VTICFAKKTLDKTKQLIYQNWEEDEVDTFNTLSKEEMNALRVQKPDNFSSINPWLVVLSQVVITLVIAFFCAVFSNRADKSVYTYSALVGGLIGFLPSALFCNAN